MMMTVPFVQVCAAVSQFIGAEIIPNVTANVFAQGALGVLVGARMPKLLEGYLDTPAVRQLGIVTDDGQVDVDLLYKMALGGFEKSPDGVPISIPDPLGRGTHVLTIKQADVDSVYRYLAGSAAKTGGPSA
jgi:hypothetical protein